MYSCVLKAKGKEWEASEDKHWTIFVLFYQYRFGKNVFVIIEILSNIWWKQIPGTE